MALCAAGYRVLMPNIRGSTTFGGPWVKGLSASWGDTDAADALAKRDVDAEVSEAVLDRLVAAGLIDDAAFAGAWVESRHHGRGLARRALASARG